MEQISTNQPWNKWGSNEEDKNGGRGYYSSSSSGGSETISIHDEYSDGDSLPTGNKRMVVPVKNMGEGLPSITDQFQGILTNSQSGTVFNRRLGEGNDKHVFSLKRGGRIAENVLSNHFSFKESQTDTPSFTPDQVKRFAENSALQKKLTDSIAKRADAKKDPCSGMEDWKKILSSDNPVQTWEQLAPEKKQMLTQVLSDYYGKKRLVLLVPKFTNEFTGQSRENSVAREVENHRKLLQTLQEVVQKQSNALKEKFPTSDLSDATVVKELIVKNPNNAELKELNAELKKLLESLQGMKHLAIPVPYALDSSFRGGQILTDKVNSLRSEQEAVRKFNQAAPIPITTPTFPIFLVEQKNAGDLEKSQGHLSVKETIGIYLDVLKGITFLNNNEIMHRDLMPRNILLQKDVTNQYTASVSDFGLSGPRDEIPSGMHRWQTAPENMTKTVNGGKEEKRSDVYVMTLGMLDVLLKGKAFLTDKGEVPDPKGLQDAWSVAYQMDRQPTLIKKAIANLGKELESLGMEKQTQNLLVSAIEGGLAVNPTKRLTHAQMHEALSAVYTQLA